MFAFVIGLLFGLGASMAFESIENVELATGFVVFTSVFHGFVALGIWTAIKAAATVFRNTLKRFKRRKPMAIPRNTQEVAS